MLSDMSELNYILPEMLMRKISEWKKATPVIPVFI